MVALMLGLIIFAAIAGLIVYATARAFDASILGRKCKQIPRPGEVWTYSHNQGPWDVGNDCYKVWIVDVLDGWVRYDMLIFKDQRCRLDYFARMYRPVSK